MSPPLRILLTGASGFVGGALSRHLRSRGHQVTGVVNSRAGHPGDLALDLGKWADFAALAGRRFDVVVHAAARMGPERFDPATRRINVDGTVNMLRFAREAGVVHFVQVGTIAAYGLRCVGEGRDESTPLSTARFHPLETEYMRSKAEAERRVVASGLPYTILRLPVVLGANSTFAAPAILPRLRAGRAPYVKRNDAKVSVVCIENLGPMLDSVLERGPALRAYNACDAHLPWRDLVELYGAALGTPVPWVRRSPLRMLLDAGDPYEMFWLTNGMVGAHFPDDALHAERPFQRVQTPAEAVTDEVAASRA